MGPFPAVVVLHGCGGWFGGPRGALGHGVVDLRTVGRLLWLILDAGGFPDIGPDMSLAAAEGARVNGETLARMLEGKTLLYGEALPRGPYRIRLRANGSAIFLRGPELIEVDTGTWRILEDQFCCEWKKIEPRQMSMTAVRTGSMLQLFDRRGVMFIEGRVVAE